MESTEKVKNNKWYLSFISSHPLTPFFAFDIEVFLLLVFLRVLCALRG